MPTRTISINVAAYERLKALKRNNESFSDVIIRFFPARKKLSHVLKELGADPELAEAIEAASETMRHERMREVDF